MPERGSNSSGSPARTTSSTRLPASVATYSSSPRPMTTTRPSSSRSFTFTTSPWRSGSKTSTALSESFRITCDPGTEPRQVQVGRRGHAHLAAAGEHVDGSVVVGAEVHAERCRRLAELLDLFRERLDPLALPAQSVGELLVLAHRPGQLVARLDELLLEDGDLAGGVGEAAAKEPDLLLQELHLGLELVDLLLVAFHLLVMAGHLRHPPGALFASIWAGLLAARKRGIYISTPFIRQFGAT